MSGNYTVYTYDEGADWLAKNTGVPDMMLGANLDMSAAGQLAERLAERYPDDTFEVRNGHDETVSTYGADNTDVARRHEERINRRATPARRTLGRRGA